MDFLCRAYSSMSVRRLLNIYKDGYNMETCCLFLAVQVLEEEDGKVH